MSVFERVVCGVDGSPEGLEAARQAGRLACGPVVLVAVVDAWDLVLGGGEPGASGSEEWEPRKRKQLRRDAEASLAAAKEAVGTDREVETRLIEGTASIALHDEVRRSGATLVAVGSHGRTRATGIVLGSVASSAVHHAPCSVLVARRPMVPERFPSSLLVGSDGSSQAALAFAAAQELRERYGAGLRVVAGSGRGVEPDVIEAQIAPQPLLVGERPALETLVAASTEADLLLVGSRGLAGVPALGSVSERVAHRAACSVLVVREHAAPERERAERALVGEVMSAPAVTARVDATVEDIARLMVEQELGAVAVVNADGQLVGIVTESDFSGREVVLSTSRDGSELRAPKLLGQLILGDTLEEAYERARRRSVSEVMTSPVLAAVESEPMQQALERMLHHRVGHLPVVRRGVPVGMLAHHDLLLLAARIWESAGETQAGPADG